jgi:hypothetical protein
MEALPPQDADKEVFRIANERRQVSSKNQIKN